MKNIATIYLVTCLLCFSNLFGSSDLTILNNSYVDYQKILFDLYVGADAKLEESERAQITAKGSSPVYGEIVYESIAFLLAELKPTSADVFYDLGCGLGRFVVQAYLTTDMKKSVGIELSQTRFFHAFNVLNRTKKIYKNSMGFNNSLNGFFKQPPIKVIKNKKIDFLNKDILEVDISDATMVYIALTLNSEEFKRKLNEKLVQLNDGLRVLSLHTLEHERLHLVNTYYLPMTWSADTPVYLYVLNKKPIIVAEPIDGKSKNEIEEKNDSVDLI